jgi:hypothetical protein
MSQNPQSMNQPPMPPLPPQTPPGMLGYAPPPARTDLRTIAVRQKAVMYCILGYFGCGVLSMVTPMPIKVIFSLGLLASMVTGAVFVFMLSIALYNTGAGIVLGILTLIPLIGLIILLVINGRATSVLREHGIKVGLMGADSRQIPAPGTVPLP